MLALLVSLPGCARENSGTTDTYLRRACEAFLQFKSSNNLNLRALAMDEMVYNFRRAAFSDSNTQYEVLAEFSSANSLSEMRHFREVNEFCTNWRDDLNNS